MSDYNRDRAISDEYTEVIEAARELLTSNKKPRPVYSKIMADLLGVVDELRDSNRRARAEERERIEKQIREMFVCDRGAAEVAHQIADAIRSMGDE